MGGVEVLSVTPGTPRAAARKGNQKCLKCGVQLTGNKLKYCSTQHRDEEAYRRKLEAREANGGKCKRCGGQLMGRQMVWCSLICKREYGTEKALVDDIEVYVRECVKCHLQKPLAAEFYKTPAGTYRRECRACLMAGNDVRKAKPDAADRARNHHLVSLYGITSEEYESVFRAQGGKCAVCGKPPLRMRLAVDHSHKTGEIRGLLCSHCNLRVIGKHTDAQLHYRAASYLERPPARDVLGVRIAPKHPPRRRKIRTRPRSPRVIPVSA